MARNGEHNLLVRGLRTSRLSGVLAGYASNEWRDRIGLNDPKVEL